MQTATIEQKPIVEFSELIKAGKQKYQDGDRAWLRTVTPHYDYFLGCVPPAFQMRGWFGVGEPWRHTGDDQPVYLFFRNRSAPECRYATIKEIEAEMGSNNASVAKKLDDGKARMDVYMNWMGNGQRAAVKEGLSGEEKQYFADKLAELAGIIQNMPKTYEQEGKGDQAMVSLHYFAGGSANFWIMEKDVDTDGEGQVQAFGLANLFGGPTDQDAELGYISIVEILQAGAELDFHFTPCTLGELKAKADERANRN